MPDKSTAVEHRAIWLALGAIILVGALVRFVDLNRQGETWDEVAYFDAGKQYLANIERGDWTPAHWDANFEHPPVGKYLYAMANLGTYRTPGLVDFTRSRQASALMGLATVLLTFLIGQRLNGPRTGLIAATTLALLPWFVGLNLVAGLDTPTAFTFALAVWLFLEALLRRSHWWYLAAAIAAGLAIGTRLSNGLVLPTLALMWIVWRWPLHGEFRIQNSEFGSGTKTLNSKFQPLYSPLFGWSELVHLVTFSTVPSLVLWASWPWLWGNDWRAHLDRTLGHWSPIKVVWLGQITVAPASYYLGYFLVVIPGLILVALVWFLWRTLHRSYSVLSQREPVRLATFAQGTSPLAGWLTVLVWLVIPFTFSFFGTRQGGLRYLLAIAPAIALATGLVVDELLTRMPRRLDRAVLVGTLAGYLGLSLAGSWSYPLDYYNELVGGPRVVAAHRWFQIGWWNEGVEPAVQWVNAHAQTGSAVTILTSPRRSDRLLRRDLALVDLPESRFVVANPGYLWYNQPIQALGRDFTVVHEERVNGAVVATVYERSDLATQHQPGDYPPGTVDYP